MFINDIPTLDIENISGSLLFADDLVTFFIYDKPGKVRKTIDNYMLAVESWLNKWRLIAAPNKCFYTIFTGNGQCRNENKIAPKFYGVELIHEAHPKILGVTFDRSLSFNKQIEDIRLKVQNRLNIIKILSGSSWHLNKEVLKSLYFALIRSIVDYSFFIIDKISVTNVSRLESVQNKAIKLIITE